MPYISESEYSKLINDVVKAQEAEDRAKRDLKDYKSGCQSQGDMIMNMSQTMQEQRDMIKNLREALADMIGHHNFVANSFDIHYGDIERVEKVFKSTTGKP